MRLLISKEKFAGINGFENLEDFEKSVRKDGKRVITAAKIEKAYDLIRKHSRYFIKISSNYQLSRPRVLFGVDFSAVEQFVDQKHRTRNIKKLLQAKDGFLGVNEESSGVKRRKQMDSSHSSNLDVSMASVSEEYLDDESKLIKENEELRCQLGVANSRIKELEAALRSKEEEIQLFKKQTFSGFNGRGGGAVKEYKQAVRVAALAALSEGETSTGIRRCWSAIATFVPELLGPSGSVPSCKTLDRIRDDLGRFSNLSSVSHLLSIHLKTILAYFNALQRDAFVQSAEFLVFSVDGTSIGQTKYTVLGMWDEACNFHCLAIDKIGHDSVTGEVLADMMYTQYLRLGITNEKPIAIMSDKAHVQYKANRLFGLKIGKKLQQLVCGQHETAILEKKFGEQLSHASLSNHCTKLLFGDRNSGPTLSLSQTSLKSELDLCLRIEKGISHSKFQTDMGSRYMVLLSNSQQLLLHKDLVMKVLAKRSKSDAGSPSRRLFCLINDHWDQLQLELGSIVYFWHTIIGPFATQMGQYNQLETVKLYHQQLEDRIQAVASSNVAFDTLRQCNNDMSRNNPEVYTIIDAAWSTATPSLKRTIHAAVQAAANAALKKAKADNKVAKEIEADGQLFFPSENRRAEAVFSALKFMARKYDSLMVDKQVDVAMAKINHLAQWAYQQDDQEMLRMMHDARANRKAVWSDRTARKNLFDREVYDRLFNTE